MNYARYDSSGLIDSELLPTVPRGWLPLLRIQSSLHGARAVRWSRVPEAFWGSKELEAADTTPQIGTIWGVVSAASNSLLPQKASGTLDQRTARAPCRELCILNNGNHPRGTVGNNSLSIKPELSYRA